MISAYSSPLQVQHRYLMKPAVIFLPFSRKRQLQQAESEIEVIVVDVAETEIERPKKTKTLL
jgi:hypothetical protein